MTITACVCVQHKRTSKEHTPAATRTSLNSEYTRTKSGDGDGPVESGDRDVRLPTLKSKRTHAFCSSCTTGNSTN